MSTVAVLGAAAKQAARFLALQDETKKNAALTAMADRLEADLDVLLDANRLDLDEGRKNGLTESLLDRLALSPERVRGMADGMRDVCGLPDPVGEIELDATRPNGLHIQRVRVPIGVIGIIYEARPNVTADAAALCLKAGNAVDFARGKGSHSFQPCHRLLHAFRAEGNRLPRGLRRFGAGYLARDGERADAVQRLSGFAHSPRRSRADPRCGGKRHRPGH